jgi:hypothetical protein
MMSAEHTADATALAGAVERAKAGDVDAERIEEAVHGMQQLHDSATLLRSHPPYLAPDAVLARVRRSIVM